jgi:hypothetical protein
LNIHVDQDGKDIVAISPGLIMSPKFKKSALTVGSSLGIELEPVKVQPEAPKTPLFKPSPRTVLKQANRDAVSDGLDVLEKEIAYQLDKQKQLELKEWERKRKRDERIRLSAEAKAIEEAKLKVSFINLD